MKGRIDTGPCFQITTHSNAKPETHVAGTAREVYDNCFPLLGIVRTLTAHISAFSYNHTKPLLFEYYFQSGNFQGSTIDARLSLRELSNV